MSKGRGGLIGHRVALAVWLVLALSGTGIVLQGCGEGPEPKPDDAPRYAPIPDVPAGLVSWQEWAERDTANAEGAPILLFLYTRRSAWSRDMVRRCFETSTLAREIVRGTWPVRVDADRRPDLAARFGMGGWPTVAFLEPGDTLITGGTYFDPEDLTDLLRRVRIRFDYADRRNDLRAAKRRLTEHQKWQARRLPRPAIAPTADLLDRLADSVRVTLNQRLTARTESLLLLVEWARSQSDEAAVPGARGRLQDLAEAVRTLPDGLYTEPLVADGRVRSGEASLAVNAGVLGALSEAAIYLDDAALRQAAGTLAAALRTSLLLRDTGLFAAGLYRDVVRSPQPTEGGLREMPVFIDGTVYAAWNALTASAFAACYRATGDTAWLAASERIIGAIERDLLDADQGIRRTLPGDSDTPFFLEDQALVARAALDVDAAAGDTTHHALARSLADAILERYRTRDGSLRDRFPERAAPHLPVVDRAVPSAAGVAVQVFVRMWQETGNTRYRDAAHDALEAHLGPNIDLASRMGGLGRGLQAYLKAVMLYGGT
jgi:uncharacterized protein